MQNLNWVICAIPNYKQSGVKSSALQWNLVIKVKFQTFSPETPLPNIFPTMYFFRTIGGSLVVLSFDSFVMNLKPLFAGTKKLKNISHLRFITFYCCCWRNHSKPFQSLTCFLLNVCVRYQETDQATGAAGNDSRLIRFKLNPSHDVLHSKDYFGRYIKMRPMNLQFYPLVRWQNNQVFS